MMGVRLVWFIILFRVNKNLLEGVVIGILVVELMEMFLFFFFFLMRGRVLGCMLELVDDIGSFGLLYGLCEFLDFIFIDGWEEFILYNG